MLLKIYITDMAAYNCGHLIGEWVHLPVEKEELKEKIREILLQGEAVCKDGIHEEIFISDAEWNDTDVFRVSQYDSPYLLNRKIGLLEESLEPYQYPMVRVLLDNGLVETFEKAIEQVENVIVYEDCSMVDVAHQYVEEFIDLNGYHDLIVSHIDYKGIAQTLEHSGEYYIDGTNIYQVMG